MCHLPALTSAIPDLFDELDEVELLREKLKALEQELALTKQQLSKYTKQDMENFSTKRRNALAQYRLEYEMRHSDDAEDEID